MQSSHSYSSWLLYVSSLIFWSLTPVVVSLEFGSIEKNENLNDHLARRLKETKVKIAKEYVRAEDDIESVVEPSYDIKWEKLGSRRFNFTEPALTVSMFNKMFILESNRTMSVDVEYASNDTSSAASLHQTAFVRQERSVKFAKSIVWKSRLYLLVCEEDDCNLYTGEKNDAHLLEHGQTMNHRGMLDGTFFTRANALYLVVTHEFPASSTMYRWTGTYMDIIKRIKTVGAVLVTSFNYGRSTILVFGQSNNKNRQPDSDVVGLEIYEFNDNGIDKIQYLSTNRPIIINHYNHKGRDFLLINERNASTVYWWDGSGNEFLHYRDLPDIVAPSGVNIVHLNGDTLFFVFYENSVCLYKVTSSGYSRLDLLELRNNGERVIDTGVWIDEKTKLLTLLLVTLDLTSNLYLIEPWELAIKKNGKSNAAGIQEAVDATEQCLKKLQHRLNDRMILMENLTRYTWPVLLASEDETTYTESLVVPELILNSAAAGNLIQIGRLEVDSSPNDTEILLPSETKTFVANTTTLVSSLLDDSRKMLKTHGDNCLVGNVIIEGDTEFRELKTNSIRTGSFNGQVINLEDLSVTTISATGNQTFSSSELRGKNITVRQLEIDQLCGIPHEYWLRDQNERPNNIFTGDNLTDVIMEKDTVLLRSTRDPLTTSLRDLEFRTIESINISNLFDNLFIVSEKQLIKGNILQKTTQETMMSVVNIVTKELNGISPRDLITRGIEQNITGNVFVGGKMLMKKIVATRINGIPITDFAMVSRKNFIKGHVTVTNLRILNQLAIDEAAKFPTVRPIQVYESVTVFGNIKTRDVVLESGTNFPLSSMINDSDTYWTKSSNQTVKNRVCFDAGLSVDELTLDYLNELDPNEDIMLTSQREIFGNFHLLEFRNLTAKQLIRDPVEDDAASSSDTPFYRLYDDSPDSLIINEEIRVERLSVRNLYIGSFNGIPVDTILSSSFKKATGSPYEYREIDSVQRFETVTVNGRLETEDLHLAFIVNNDNEQVAGEAGRKRLDNRLLRFDANYTIHRLKSKKITLGDVRINSYTETTINDILTQRDYCNSKLSVKNSSLESGNDCSHLVIEGDAMIEKNLEVEAINHKSTQTYLDELAIEGMSMNFDDTLIIDNLTVRHNLTVNFLRGSRLEKLYESTLSKSREQYLGDSRISFFEISVDDLKVEWINGLLTRHLINLDSYEINFGQDVIFGNLNIPSGDSVSTPSIRAKYFNGCPANELYEKLGNISLRIVNNLRVQGNVFWQRTRNSDPEDLSRLETITRRGLRRNNTSPIVINTNNVEQTSTIIESSRGVFVASMNLIEQETMARDTGVVGSIVNGTDIRKIIYDSVLDDPIRSRETNGTRIGGVKTFEKDLGCVRLVVPGEIGVQQLTRWIIHDLESSIVRVDPSRDHNLSFVTTTVIFRNGVALRKLVIQDKHDHSSPHLLVHGLPVSGVVTTVPTEDHRKFLPESTYLRHLVVMNNAFVKSLDSINLDEFANDRVDLRSASVLQTIVIHGNIQFNGRIGVSENASVGSINGIVPRDLVMNDSSEDQIIFGNETLISGDMVMNGNMYAPLVAGISLKDAYDNAVLNYNSVEIFGDIIFQADVEKSSGFMGMPSEEWDLQSISTQEKIPGGFVNEIRLRSLVEDCNSNDVDFLTDIARNESHLEARIARISNIHLPEIFYYFEAESNLIVNGAANVERVRVTELKETTILGMYTNELGSYCGLADECPCKRQYVAEITANGDDFRSWKVQDHRIFYHFYEPSGAFAVSVATTTVSRSEHCRLLNSNSDYSDQYFEELTTISWMKDEQQLVFLHHQPSSSSSALGSNVTKDALKIYGYLSDAVVFTQNDLVFIVLAIYYDPILSTHQTNSFVYVLDLATNVLKLAQNIPTCYAVGVQVIKVPNKGPHIFFSSFADGEPTESVLYGTETHTAEFRLLRSFLNGGNRHAKSVSRSNEEFLFLDDATTNSINVYRYDSKMENFYLYQSIYHDSMAPIASIETFYTGEFRHSEVYVIVTTNRDQFFVYEYTFMRKFELIMKKRVSGILSMIPFDVADRRYVFVGTDRNSTILRIVEQGSSRGAS